MRAALLVVTLALLAGPATADPRDYIGAADQPESLGMVSLSCGLDNLQPSLSGVCFPAGHVTPSSSTSSAVIAIQDDILSPVSGVYCQDLNGDLRCGAPGEHTSSICGTLWLRAVAGPDGEVNWDPNRDIQVYVDGPVNGNPLLSSCGWPNVSMGTKGKVVHT